MIKGTSSGQTAKKSDVVKQTEQLSKQWKELRNRLDSLLMVNNFMRGNDLRQQCIVMDAMTTAERNAHIKKHWGPLYLERVQPIIQQLENLERIIGIGAEPV